MKRTAQPAAGGGGRSRWPRRSAAVRRAGRQRSRRREARRVRRRARRCPTVTIDFDGLQHRILAVPGIPERQYSNLKAGAAGMVYFLEAAAGGGGGRGGAGGGATLHRYSLRDHRDVPFVTGAADYDVSLDGHKLAVSRRWRWRRSRRTRWCAQVPAVDRSSSSSTPIAIRRRPVRAAVDRRSARVRRSEAGVQADLRRSVAQPARLPLRAERTRRRLAEGEADVLARSCRT